MRSLISGAVALAGMPVMAATGSAGIASEAVQHPQWVRQQHRNGVILRARGFNSTFSTASADYAIDASFDCSGSVEPYCKVIDLSRNQVSAPIFVADATADPRSFDVVETRAEAPQTLLNSFSLFDDAAAFASAAKILPWKPQVWEDEGEIVFEWISGPRHAVVSIEGDGRIGYTMLVGDQFIAGSDSDAVVHSVPNDLLDYLAESA